MKKLKRKTKWMRLLLSLCMVLSMVPLTAFAEEAESTKQSSMVEHILNESNNWDISDNDHKELPEPSNITHVDDGVVVIIPYDYLEYNRKYHNKSIKKTLTIPEWLNNEALRLNLNFSQILQDALLNKIQSR